MTGITYPYLSLNETPDNSWRMRKYIKGMSITTFASFLAWTGMVIGIISAIAALDLVFLPLVLGLHNYRNYSDYRNYYNGNRRIWWK